MNGIINAINRVVEKLGALSLSNEQAIAKIDLSTAQSIVRATYTKLNLDRLVFQRGNINANITNKKIIVNTSGIYQVTFYEQWADCKTGIARGVKLYKNGLRIEVIFISKDGAGRWYNATNGVYEASAGDYFEIYVYQDSDANLNMTSASMTVQKISN